MVKVKKISSNPRPSKANRSKAVVSDEEILSDEEVSDMDGEGESVFEIEETAEEAKIRLAKQMISNAEQEEEDVESVLKKYALEERGRLFVPVAESLPEVLDPPTFAKGHINSITCIRVAKDGSIYTGSKDCCIIVWDPITLKKTKILKGFRHNRKTGNHFDEILALDITDDSKFLATGGKDRIIRLWNGVTLEPIDMLKGHRDTVTGLAFQRNTHLLYSASADRSVKVWNLDDMAYLNTLFGHQSFIMGIDSFTSERAVTCGDDKTVRVWKSIEEVQQVYAGHEASIDCIAIVSADTFLTGSQDGAVGMWKVHKKKPVFMLNNAHGGGDYWISSLSVLRNTDLAASGSHDGNINLYRVEQESLTLLMKIPVVGYVNCLSFARSGQFLAVGIGQDHRLGRWTSTQRAKNGVTLVPLPISLNINVQMEGFQDPLIFGSTDSLTTEDEAFDTYEYRDQVWTNLQVEYNKDPEKLERRKKRNVREELRLKRELDALKAENAAKEYQLAAFTTEEAQIGHVDCQFLCDSIQEYESTLTGHDEDYMLQVEESEQLKEMKIRVKSDHQKSKYLIREATETLTRIEKDLLRAYVTKSNAEN